MPFLTEWPGRARRALQVRHPASVRCERGQSFVFLGMLLPLLICILGAGYDLGRAYMQKSDMQNAADAAALAGVTSLRPDKAVAEQGREVREAVGSYVKNNVTIHGVSKTEVRKSDDLAAPAATSADILVALYKPEEVTFTGAALEEKQPYTQFFDLSVDLHGASPTTFLRLLGLDTIPLHVHAKARNSWLELTDKIFDYVLYGNSAKTSELRSASVYTTLAGARFYGKYYVDDGLDPLYNEDQTPAQLMGTIYKKKPEVYLAPDGTELYVGDWRLACFEQTAQGQVRAVSFYTLEVAKGTGVRIGRAPNGKEQKGSAIPRDRVWIDQSIPENAVTVHRWVIYPPNPWPRLGISYRAEQQIYTGHVSHMNGADGKSMWHEEPPAGQSEEARAQVKAIWAEFLKFLPPTGELRAAYDPLETGVQEKNGKADPYYFAANLKALPTESFSIMEYGGSAVPKQFFYTETEPDISLYEAAIGGRLNEDSRNTRSFIETVRQMSSDERERQHIYYDDEDASTVKEFQTRAGGAYPNLYLPGHTADGNYYTTIIRKGKIAIQLDFDKMDPPKAGYKGEYEDMLVAVSMEGNASEPIGNRYPPAIELSTSGTNKAGHLRAMLYAPKGLIQMTDPGNFQGNVVGWRVMVYAWDRTDYSDIEFRPLVGKSKFYNKIDLIE